MEANDFAKTILIKARLEGFQILERDVDEVFQKWAFSAEIRNNVRPKTTLKAGADCLIAKVDGPG